MSATQISNYFKSMKFSENDASILENELYNIQLEYVRNLTSSLDSDELRRELIDKITK